jgi:hypothetical protein
MLSFLSFFPFFLKPFLSIQKREKIAFILSSPNHQALGVGFIGQCCPKAWLTVPIWVRNLLLYQ